MQGVDLAIIKDIPGYKIIMKAVLKHQIQQLVEQLSETTGEESILLTASVSDGTLSHLGSESGKSFLDGHDEIKSQFLGFVLKSHHTKKTEKQFAAGPGRKSITQQSLPLVYEESDASYTEASYDRELQQDVIQERAMMPTGSTGKKKRKATKAAPSHYDIKTRPKRSAAATKSPLKFGIYVDEIDDMELSDNEQEQIKSAAATVTEPSSEDSQVKYTEIVPVSGPIPVVPKLNTEDSFQTEEFSEGSATFSGAMGEFANVENIVVKKEAESDIEAGVVMEEEDPDWKPGTKKRRKSSGSRSVSSPVNASGDQAQMSLPHQETSRRGYACRFCDKPFFSPYHVTRHERIHTGEKPYSCEICGKSFADKGNLSRHQAAHTGEKSYTCEICGKAFLQKRDMNSHQIAVHFDQMIDQGHEI